MDPLSLDKQAADFIKELATNCEANGLEPVTISETALVWLICLSQELANNPI